MNILVTGGAGFVGSHLCDRLIAQGNKVICLDSFDEFYPKAIKKENIKELKENTKFHLITGDVRDTDNLIDILTTKKVEMIVHLAGKCGAVNSLKNPLDYISSNVNGTVSILEAAKEAEINKLIFSSSSTVYGNGIDSPFTEDSLINTPTSPYAASKQAAEMFIKMYHEMHGISAVVLRLFSVYGPRQRPDSGMYQFIKANLKKQNIAIYGEGKILRDYTYIEDVVDGFDKAIAFLSKVDEPVMEIFNLGSSQPNDIQSIFELIEKNTLEPTLLSYKKSPLGNLHATHADISKAQQKLNYASNTAIAAGIKTTIEWMRKVENL
ncbi:MAG: SDR family NAD(P)-dependent oxidoreductase [Cytophagales bacterium]